MSLATAVTIYVVNDYLKSTVSSIIWDTFTAIREALNYHQPPWTVDADADADAYF